MTGPELPVEVILSIQRILEIDVASQDSDPLDSLANDFSPTDVLNELFPDEASLGRIEIIQAKLAHDERELQREIDELHVNLKRDQDPRRMLLIQEMISELLGQMSRIREKATESEAVVRNITKDIQVLDLAKKNLILSMTTLKRLQMLVNAVTQMEELVAEKKYPEIAQSLSAIKHLSPTFQSFTSIPHIAQLWKRIRAVEGSLRVEIEATFDRFFLQNPPVPSPAILTSACLAVDVLPVDLRASLISRCVNVELKDYRRIFRVDAGSLGSGVKSEPNEAAALDNFERRFAWFRRMFNRHEADSGTIFPAEWKVGWSLVGTFVDITRDDLTTLLSRAASGGELTVKLLLDTLAIVAEFETWAMKRFTVPLQEVICYHAASTTNPPKSISFAFEAHTGIFTDAQDKALADMLAPHLPKSTKSRTSHDPRPSLEAEPSEPPAVVLPSSTEMFYFFGQSLEQCVKLGIGAGTGKALFELTTVWKKWLKVYAEDVLLVVLKRPRSARRSTETRWDAKEVKEVCLIINTAEYCLNTTSQLEEKIKEKINEEHKAKVSLQTEHDLFLSVISSSINILLTHLDAAIEPSFNAMARTSYLAHSQVSGQSTWVADLLMNVELVVGCVKGEGEGGVGGVEGKKYIRNFLDKCCSLVLAKFTAALVKSRPLGQGGAEQLLIDLQAIKACLSKLPGEALATTSYMRGLTKSTARLEVLLKVVVTPDDPPEGFILNYTLLIGDSSFSNFQKILDLKGTPKALQNDLLDAFVTITSTKSELETTSFLSSLDMDPSPHNLTTSPNATILALPLISGLGEASSGPSTGDSNAVSPRPGDQRREKFSDFKRFVSFGLRRDSQMPF